MANYVLQGQKWLSSTVSWYFDESSKFFAEVLEAINLWDVEIGLDFVQTSVAAAANIVIKFGPIDGAYNVLGEAHSFWSVPSNLYTGDTIITFDSGENWSWSEAADSYVLTSGTTFTTVALHEIGHAIGLGHSSNSSTIMHATASNTIAALDHWDIAGAQAIYGIEVDPIPLDPALDILFDANPDVARGLTIAYQVFLGGIPNQEGFLSLVDSAVSTNFGAGNEEELVFNAENIYINLVNNLVQGNQDAAATLEGLMSSLDDEATLADKVGVLYKAITPLDDQTDVGLDYLTRPESLTFYQQLAEERGITDSDGAIIIAAASLLQILVAQDIGVGNNVNDFIAAVDNDTAVLPATSSDLIDINIADGTFFDADDSEALSLTDSSSEIAAASENQVEIIGFFANDLWLG